MWIRSAAPLLLLVATLASCERPAMSTAERDRVAADVKRTLVDACDLSKGDVVNRLMSLYPDSGPVVSASVGRVTTTRSALEQSIRGFWERVGQNLRNPTWEWEDMEVTVLGPDAAAVTATYRIPHHTPAGAPHVVGGAWTAVFERRHGKWLIVQEHLSDAPPTPGA